MNVLARYFEETQDTPASLAARIGREPSTITRIEKRERNASPELAMDIERGTGGKIKAVDLMKMSVECPVIRRTKAPERAVAP